MDFQPVGVDDKTNILADIHSSLSGAHIENYYFQQFMADFFKIKISVVAAENNFPDACTEKSTDLEDANEALLLSNMSKLGASPPLRMTLNGGPQPSDKLQIK